MGPPSSATGGTSLAGTHECLVGCVCLRYTYLGFMLQAHREAWLPSSHHIKPRQVEERQLCLSQIIKLHAPVGAGQAACLQL
jgi:hypothetical protein